MSRGIYCEAFEMAAAARISGHATDGRGDMQTRVAHVETEVGFIKQSLGDLKVEMRTTLADITTAVSALRNDIAKAPRALPAKEIVVVIAAACGALTFAAGFANWWLYASLQPIRENVAGISKVADPGEIAVLRYRVAQLEAMVKR